MNTQKTVLVSLALYAIFIPGLYYLGFQENATVGTMFWLLALMGGLFQVYAIKTLHGRYKLIPLVPLILFSLGIVGIIIYFMTINPS